MTEEQLFIRMSPKAAKQYDELRRLESANAHMRALLITAKIVYPQYQVEHLTEHLACVAEHQSLYLTCAEGISLYWNPLQIMHQTIALQKALMLDIYFQSEPPTLTCYAPPPGAPADTDVRCSMWTMGWDGSSDDYFQKLKEIIVKTSVLCVINSSGQ